MNLPGPSSQPFSGEQEIPVVTPANQENPLLNPWEQERLEQLKLQAQQLKEAKNAMLKAQLPVQQPQVVYVRRNLTVAELLVVFILSCGIVTGFQWGWGFVSTNIPRIEVRVR
jgi:hypothetical protein